MTAEIETSGPASAARRKARRLRMAAVIMLMLGLIGVGAVYQLGRPQDVPDELSTAYKANERQAEYLYGKSGLWLQELLGALKKPDTQAVIIVAASWLIAAGCLYVARQFEMDASASRAED